jgi:hypothetical protein
MANATAGRFGILRDVADSLSDEDGFQASGKQSGADKGTNKPGKSIAKNAKKRARKRAAKTGTSDTFVSANGSSIATVGDEWKDWQTRDKIVADDQFEKDLQEAIMQSMLEEEKRQAEEEEIARAEAALLQETRDKRQHQKKGKIKVSLQEWQAGLDSLESPLEAQPPSEMAQEDDTKSPAAGTAFFDRVSIETAAEMDREQLSRAIRISQETKAESARLAYETDTIEKKDKMIHSLLSQVQELQNELKEVKLRNKQLCHILSKGEMKEKSELIQQCDEITQVKDELTAEVSI